MKNQPRDMFTWLRKQRHKRLQLIPVIPTDERFDTSDERAQEVKS